VSASRGDGARVPTVIEVVTVIDAAPIRVFGLELDVDVHAGSLPGSRETATTSTGRRRLALGDEVTFRARHFDPAPHQAPGASSTRSMTAANSSGCSKIARWPPRSSTSRCFAGAWSRAYHCAKGSARPRIS
jgi:hypothetical protein